MKILDFYIGRIIISTTFLTTFVLVGLSGLIRFIEEMRKVGRGNYDTAQAFFYVIFSTPRDIEVFLPMAALLGGLIGLGMLASNSELVIMKASGWSQFDIIKSVMKTATLLVVAVMLLGEFGAPKAEAFAMEFRTQAISGGSLISSKNGVWTKDGNDFVFIGEVEDTVSIKDISIFKFNQDLQLTSIYYAKSGVYDSNNINWSVEDTWEKFLFEEKITRETKDIDSWVSNLTPEKLSVVTVKPESLSLRGLSEYLHYLKQNEQDTSRYDLAFWRKILQPLTVAVMLLVALSFISGPLRTVTMGARIVLGIVVGFGFHITNQVFGPMSLVYQLPPFFGAIMPSLLFIGVAVYLLRKQT